LAISDHNIYISDLGHINNWIVLHEKDQKLIESDQSRGIEQARKRKDFFLSIDQSI